MHVVMVSKALVVGAYQRKAEELARQGIKLTVLAPTSWRDRRGRETAVPRHTAGYTFRTIPIRFNGSFHLHYYPTLGRELADLRPDLLHMDEEPYNLATWLALRQAQRLGTPALFFTWQNLLRRYPPPFGWWEQANYRRAAHVLAGNAAAADVLRTKGYRGPITVLPQFGVDPAVYAPRAADFQDASEQENDTPFTIGYAGGFVPEKGVDLLLRACAGLQGAWRLHCAGAGDERDRLCALAAELAIAEHVRFEPRLDSDAMPGFYSGLHVLVLPSRTRPNWKEQFGRVLIEAMACGVPVVGSDCGEIPNVVGEAGLIFAEDDVGQLRQALQQLHDTPGLRRRLAQSGRARVLAHYTMEQVAAATVDVYHRMLAQAAQPL